LHFGCCFGVKRCGIEEGRYERKQLRSGVLTEIYTWTKAAAILLFSRREQVQKRYVYGFCGEWHEISTHWHPGILAPVGGLAGAWLIRFTKPSESEDTVRQKTGRQQIMGVKMDVDVENEKGKGSK
jgi:hypothetical protein